MALPAKVDTRTCRQIQDAAIADLQVGAGYAAAATERLVRQLEALERRVTALEAQVSDTISIPVLGSLDSATGVITWSSNYPPEVQP
jgi:hypothetical protein